MCTWIAHRANVSNYTLCLQNLVWRKVVGYDEWITPQVLGCRMISSSHGNHQCFFQRLKCCRRKSSPRCSIFCFGSKCPRICSKYYCDYWLWGDHQSVDSSFQRILHVSTPLELVLHSHIGGKCSSTTLRTFDSYAASPVIHTFSPPPPAATPTCHLPFKAALWHFCNLTLATVTSICTV